MKSPPLGFVHALLFGSFLLVVVSCTEDVLLRSSSPAFLCVPCRAIVSKTATLFPKNSFSQS
jgi:hypothetical protein